MTSSTVASHRRWLELQLDLPTIRVWLPVAACACIVALAAFSAPVDIGEGRSSGPIYQPLKGPSIVFKLTTAGAAGLVGLWGVFCLPRVRQLHLSLPGVLLWSVACLFFLTTPTAVTNSALAIALVFVCYLLFVPTCLVVLQVPGLMKAMFFGILAYTSVSLLMYLFLPNYGVYLEDLGEGILSARLGGMSQPNQTGRMASIGLLLSTVFFRQMPNQRWFYAASAALCFSVAWLAMSRTALVGCAVCLLVAHWDLLMTRIGLIACGGLALGACALLIGLSVSGYDDVLLKKSVGVFSKTGDVEEFTTVTGRSEIWAESLKLISRRPLQGYGLGSAKVLLVDHLQSTHNILLHPLLAAGIGAGLITLVLLLWNLLTAFIYPHALIRALAAYVLISGLTEDTIYETFPGVLTLIWLTCCLVPQMPNNCREWFQPPRDLKKTSGNLEGCRS